MLGVLFFLPHECRLAQVNRRLSYGGLGGYGGLNSIASAAMLYGNTGVTGAGSSLFDPVFLAAHF